MVWWKSNPAYLSDDLSEITESEFAGVGLNSEFRILNSEFKPS